MPFIPQPLLDFWQAGYRTPPSPATLPGSAITEPPSHVGIARFTAGVRVRTGRFNRHYAPWAGGDVTATVGDSDPANPWQAYWTATGDWIDVPGLVTIDEQQNYSQNGVRSMTITIENLVYLGFAAEGGGTWHARKRGWLSPFRGYNSGTLPVLDEDGTVVTENAWFNLLKRDAQVDVFLGYGDQTVRAFTGLIDDVDLTSRPDRLTLTVRDFGKTLTDSKLFGWNHDPALKDPITFIDRTHAGGTHPPHWVLVDDIADIVKVICRWAGFQEWNIESTGTRLPKRLIYNRDQTYMDVIQDVCNSIGYVFHMRAPTSDDLSISIPTFRYPSVTDLTQVPLVCVKDTMMLEAIDIKDSEEALAYIIRAQGREDASGVSLGGAPGRVTYTFRPPWAGSSGAGYQDDTLAGIIRHVIHIDNLYTSEDDCRFACYDIALREALASVQATVQFPGLPGLELDEQIQVIDLGTGINSRLLIAELNMHVDRSEKAPQYIITVKGPLTDTPDIAAMVEVIHGATPRGG